MAIPKPHPPLMFNKNTSEATSQKHCLEELESALVDFIENHNESELLRHIEYLLKHDFRPYRHISGCAEDAHVETALSLPIRYHNKEAFNFIFERYNKLHQFDVLSALHLKDAYFLNKMIVKKPLKTFEYLLQLCFHPEHQTILPRMLSAMDKIIAIQGPSFLSDHRLKSDDNTDTPETPVSAAVNHYHPEVLEFLLRKGANPNSFLHGQDGATLLEGSAYHWYDSYPHCFDELTAVCLTLIGAGARMDNLSIDMKTKLLQAALAQKHQAAALKLISCGALDIQEKIEHCYRNIPFSCLSLAKYVAKRFFSLGPQIKHFTEQERQHLKQLISSYAQEILEPAETFELSNSSPSKTFSSFEFDDKSSDQEEAVTNSQEQQRKPHP